MNATLLARTLMSSGSPLARNSKGRFCRKRSSPCSIDHNFVDVTESQKRVLLPLAALSINFIYQQLVKHSLWDTRFERGGQSMLRGICVPLVRSLATRHLCSPATDGWNAVAGAVELASAWGLNFSDLPPTLRTYQGYELPQSTRIRLAVCLSVAWKFERQLCSFFPRRFYDILPSVASPHTYELAYLGYSFMNEDERVEFGGWGEENEKNIHALYADMVRMEVSLLVDVPVFSTLMRSGQVLAEGRIQELFNKGVLSDEEAMIVRSIVPFFSAVCHNGYSDLPGPGALVYAALQCMRMGSHPSAHRDISPNDDLVRRDVSQFAECERKEARALMLGGLSLRGVPRQILSLGCYADMRWVNYAYVQTETLQWALLLAEECE